MHIGPQDPGYNSGRKSTAWGALDSRLGSGNNSLCESVKDLGELGSACIAQLETWPIDCSQAPTDEVAMLEAGWADLGLESRPIALLTLPLCDICSEPMLSFLLLRLSIKCIALELNGNGFGSCILSVFAVWSQIWYSTSLSLSFHL